MFRVVLFGLVELVVLVVLAVGIARAESPSPDVLDAMGLKGLTVMLDTESDCIRGSGYAYVFGYSTARIGSSVAYHRYVARGTVEAGGYSESSASYTNRGRGGYVSRGVYAGGSSSAFAR